jgi:hypothetical protein
MSIRECSVYLWMDRNTPFYVGIGSKKRSKCRSHNKQAEGRRLKSEASKSFRIDYLHTGSRLSCADLESFLICHYGSVVNGGLLFNFTPGGDGGVDSNLLPKESLDRMKAGCSRGGKTTHLKYPDLAKTKCKKLGEKHGAKNGKKAAPKLRKPVVCVETGIQFESAGVAAKMTSVSRCNISRCCTGSLETAGGFHWIFKEAEQ